MAAEPEKRHRLRDDAGLVQLAGANLEPRADTERVVLAAPQTERREPDAPREGGAPPVVAEHVDAALAAENDVLIAVAIDVRDHQRSDGIALYLRRQELAAIRQA